MIVNFTINSIPYSVISTDYPAETTLNHFIRSYVGLHGTKFMCNEGGCGCCILSAKIYDPFNKTYKIISLNSCLKLLGACDGLEITTIEAIGNKRIGYHPIQTTLANSNGTQCGYCSPGMVMTMYSLLQKNNSSLTENEIENSFDGNICRCTGYRPILDAMKSFASQNIVDIEDLSTKCCKLNINKSEKLKDSEDFELVDITEDYEIALCPEMNPARFNNTGDYIVWYRPNSIIELCHIFNCIIPNKKYILICGGTGNGVVRRPDDIEVFIDINKICEFYIREICTDRIEIGANTSISDVLEMMSEASTRNGFEYCAEIYKHWRLVATLSCRNVAGLAGNLMIKHDYNIFPSDIFTILEAINAKIEITSNLQTVQYTPLEFLSIDMNKKAITKIILPLYNPNDYIFKSYKIMIRSQNAHALLNAAFLLKIESTPTQLNVLSASLCFGNISSDFVHATETENFMINKNLLEQNVIEQILAEAYEEIYPGIGYDNVRPLYRRILACGLLYKFFLSIIPSNHIASRYLSGKDILQREISFGNQTFDVKPEKYPVGKPIPKLEAQIQCSGEAFYSNDVPKMSQELWAAYVTAINVGSILIDINPNRALKMPGVVAFFGAKDIPGYNSFVLVGAYPFFVEDEPVFLEINSYVQYYDQPVGILVGSDRYSLYKAVKKVKLMYKKPPFPTSAPIFSINDIKEKFDILESEVSNVTKRVTRPCKNYESTSKKIIRSNLSINGQYHFTMEPQTVICIPTENGITLYCANQFIDFHQIVLERFLKLAQKNIYIETVRLGGAYGGKYSRPAQIACAAALACLSLNRPIRFVLTVEEMMRTIGKRPPLNCEYTAGVNMSNGQILDLSVKFYTDLGWNLNESAMIAFTLPALTNCYKNASSWIISGNEVKTQAASNTWCRAPGSFEGIAMIETIMENIGYELGIDPVDVRLANIGDDNKMKMLLPQFVQSVDYRNRKQEIEQFNNENRWIKKGIAISLMEFRVLFFGPQIIYLVVYHGDGTINICHGGIEMGQGLNTKVLQVASYSLGIPMEDISFRPTNSFVTGNCTFTAGSYTSETICLAVKKACDIIKSRLKPIKESISEPNPTWLTIIQKAFAQNVSLNVIESVAAGELPTYPIFGLSCSEVEADMLTGNVQVKRVDICEDTGESLSPLIDIGQIEGAFIMGLGLWFTEKLVYDKITGELLTDRPFTYKVPLATDIPINFNINLLQNSPNPVGFLRSKTTGEPAVCLAISALFALRQAIISARKDSGNDEWCALGGPTTPEEVLLNSGTDFTQFHLN